MPIKSLDRHRRVTVMGLGLFGGGVGAARFWAELGAEVTVTDLRGESELAPSIAQLEDLNCHLVLGEHRDDDFKNADLIIVNPAVNPENKYLRLARSAGAEIVTEIGLVFRLVKGDVVAITGSNGKSTTTALTGAMLKAHDENTLVGGNIGGSLLPELKHHLPSSPVVLELSSFQLHYLKFQQAAPHIAVITNLSPNHLDWHRTVLNYYEDKRNILRFQTEHDFAVINSEDPVLCEWAESCPARVIRTAMEDPGGDACFLSNGNPETGDIIMRFEGVEFKLAHIASIRIPGAHNAVNALQAAAAAWLRSQDVKAVDLGLKNFNGLPHRLEYVETVGGKKFVNDSIATTPESTICALNSFKEPKVLIAGGYDKGISFDQLGEEILRKAHSVVLIGNTAEKIRHAIEKALAEYEEHSTGISYEPLIIDAGPDFDSAVKVAGEICPEGGVVLLSPACASYDMFINFEQRGDVFKKIVSRMNG
ncbi:MAG: UDP-N-acetylmuramoyl-L-alanine--D-glutamate ligase [Planctomycetes bacterium]|nr:UDP-N-acetylmuramoyl-L-alanine--D-glutamate ligase [Planctomycetota bacterium]